MQDRKTQCFLMFSMNMNAAAWPNPKVICLQDLLFVDLACSFCKSDLSDLRAVAAKMGSDLLCKIENVMLLYDFCDSEGK